MDNVTNELVNSDMKQKSDEHYLKKIASVKFRKNNKYQRINEKFIEKVKECQLTDNELEYLRELNIKPLHKIPAQHQIEKLAGSRILKKNEREEFEKICCIKNGSFSYDEDKIIIRNWNTFCQTHKWDPLKPTPFLHIKFGGRSIIPSKFNRIKFVQILANGLPCRTLYSVYHRFRNLHSNHNVSRYSETEDNKIWDYIQNSSKEDEKIIFSILAKQLGRTRMSVWRRYQLLKKQRNSRIKQTFISKEKIESSDDSNSTDTDKSDESSVEKNKKVDLTEQHELMTQDESNDEEEYDEYVL